MTEERLTATDRLQHRLEADILTGALPPATRIKPATLAPDYGVSVTPFREALARLQSRGLIVVDPFIGASVAPISSAEIKDLFGVRLLLERPALARAVERADPAWEPPLRDAFKRLSAASRAVSGTTGTQAKTLRWLEAHRAFHWALIAGTDSAWSLRLLSTLYDHLDRYQALAWSGDGLREGSMSQHEELYESYLAGDAARATDALDRHLRSAEDHIVEVVEAMVGPL